VPGGQLLIARSSVGLEGLAASSGTDALSAVLRGGDISGDADGSAARVVMDFAPVFIADTCRGPNGDDLADTDEQLLYKRDCSAIEKRSDGHLDEAVMIRYCQWTRESRVLHC
jgi:hypothetical protein